MRKPNLDADDGRSTIAAAGDLVFISCYGGNTIVMTY
jgi:hypothetical protein